MKLRVVRGRRGDPGENVVSLENGRRYRDGALLCDKDSRRYVVADGKRWRKVHHLDYAEPDEAVYLVPFEDRKDESEKRKPGFYRNRRKLRPQPKGEVVVALCQAFETKDRGACEKHGAQHLRGFLAPGKKHLRYSKVIGELAEAYRRHREDPDAADVSDELALHRGLLETRIVPRLQAGLDLGTLEQIWELSDAVSEALGEKDLEGATGHCGKLREILTEAREGERPVIEYARHEKAITAAARVQGARDRQLERLVREQDLKAFAFRTGQIVVDAFADLLSDFGPKTKVWRRARRIIDRVQSELAYLFRPPDDAE